MKKKKTKEFKPKKFIYTLSNRSCVFSNKKIEEIEEIYKTEVVNRRLSSEFKKDKYKPI